MDAKKTKKEKTVVFKGYEEVIYILEDRNSAYMPNGWSYSVDKKDKTKLYCTKCTKKDSNDAIWVA